MPLTQTNTKIAFKWKEPYPALLIFLEKGYKIKGVVE